MLSRLFTKLPHPGRLRAGQLLVVCGLVIGLGLAAAMTWYVVTSRRSVIADAVREMRNDALMLAEQEDRQLQAVDMVQRELIGHMREIGIDSPEMFERFMTTPEVHANLRDRVAGLSYITALSLLDRHGAQLNFSRGWPPPPIDDAERDFIRGLTASDAANSFISAPSRSEIAGTWTLWLGREFRASDGSLIGFVVSTIQIDYFEAFFARLPLTGGGTFALFRRDGILLARYPHVDSNIGRSFSGTTNFNRLFDNSNHGVVRQTGALDGADRLFVPHEIEHFPLAVVVSDTMPSILSGWLDEIRILVATTALLELLIAGSVMLTLRHLRGQGMLLAAESARAGAEASLAFAEQRALAAQTLHVQEQRFDTALQNILQGLLMVSHDGIILVVNRPFCELFGISTDVLMPGMRYSELARLSTTYGNVPLADAQEIGNRRKELIVRGEPAMFLWELSDGRAFMVTHRAMEEGWLTTTEDITHRRVAEAGSSIWPITICSPTCPIGCCSMKRWITRCRSRVAAVWWRCIVSTSTSSRR